MSLSLLVGDLAALIHFVTEVGLILTAVVFWAERGRRRW
jgi:hypothetical protein